jgi:hypothetical protein
MILTVLKSTCQVLLERSPTWVCLIFPHSWSEVMDFCKEHHRGEVLFHHIILEVTRSISAWLIAGDVDLDHLVNIMPVRFLHCIIIVFPFHYSYIRSKSHLRKKIKLYCLETGTKIYIHNLKFFHKEVLSLLYLFIHVC